jgi:hypothetical protein
MLTACADVKVMNTSSLHDIDAKDAIVVARCSIDAQGRLRGQVAVSDLRSVSSFDDEALLGVTAAENTYTT